MPTSRPLEERFWEKVDKQGPTGPYLDTPCWTWTASVNRRGYGLIGIKASRSTTAHRVSWLINRGPIPDGLHVLHRCHRTSCVNPDHLYLGTCVDNAKDRVNASRVNAPKGSDHILSKLNESDVSEILSLRSKGETSQVIARRFSITTTTVCDICTGRSWRHVDRSQYDPSSLKPGPRRGSTHPRYQITPLMRNEMRQMRRNGLTCQQIADQLNVSKATVSKVCKGIGSRISSNHPKTSN